MLPLVYMLPFSPLGQFCPVMESSTNTLDRGATGDCTRANLGRQLATCVVACGYV